jgi:hypothetical protein
MRLLREFYCNYLGMVCMIRSTVIACALFACVDIKLPALNELSAL